MVGDKSIAKVKIIHCSSFIHQIFSCDHWTVSWLSVIFPSQVHTGHFKSSFCPSCVWKWLPRWVALSPLWGLSWSGSACSLLDFLLLLKIEVTFVFFLSSVTTLNPYDLWKIQWRVALQWDWPSPSGWWVSPIRSHGFVHVHLFKCSLTSSSSSEGACSSSSSLESICLDSLEEGPCFLLP